MNELTVQNKQTAVEVRSQVNLIQEVMKSVMKVDTHYGTIPGCKKPTLYKAGAEVLATTFRLAVEPVVDDLSVHGEIRYRVNVKLTNINDGNFVGMGIGECSTDEEKYKWRKAVCEGEFEDTDETQRREKWVKPYNGTEYKLKQVRTNPADLANTVLKMAKKRAQIDAILTATAASDLFTQDIEDLPKEIQEEVVSENTEQPKGKPETAPPQSKSQTNGDVINDAQGKRFYAICRGAGMTNEDIKPFLTFNFELESSREIPKARYDEICTKAGEWKA